MKLTIFTALTLALVSSVLPGFTPRMAAKQGKARKTTKRPGRRAVTAGK